MRLIIVRAGHIVGWTTHKILLWKPLLFVNHFMLSYQAFPCSSSPCSSSPSLPSPCFSILQVTRNWRPWQRSTVTLWQPCDASLCRIAAPIYDRMLGLQIPAVCRGKNEWWTPVIYTFRPLYKYFRQLLLQITTGVSYKALLIPDPICPSSQGCWIDGLFTHWILVSMWLAFTYHSNPILTCSRVAEWDMFRMGDNYQRGMQSWWMELGIGGLMLWYAVWDIVTWSLALTE